MVSLNIKYKIEVVLSNQNIKELEEIFFSVNHTPGAIDYCLKEAITHGRLIVIKYLLENYYNKISDKHINYAIQCTYNMVGKHIISNFYKRVTPLTLYVIMSDKLSRKCYKNGDKIQIKITNFYNAIKHNTCLVRNQNTLMLG